MLTQSSSFNANLTSAQSRPRPSSVLSPSAYSTSVSPAVSPRVKELSGRPSRKAWFTVDDEPDAPSPLKLAGSRLEYSTGSFEDIKPELPTDLPPTTPQLESLTGGAFVSVPYTPKPKGRPTSSLPARPPFRLPTGPKRDFLGKSSDLNAFLSSAAARLYPHSLSELTRGNLWGRVIMLAVGACVGLFVLALFGASKGFALKIVRGENEIALSRIMGGSSLAQMESLVVGGGLLLPCPTEMAALVEDNPNEDAATQLNVPLFLEASIPFDPLTIPSPTARHSPHRAHPAEQRQIEEKLVELLDSPTVAYMESLEAHEENLISALVGRHPYSSPQVVRADLMRSMGKDRVEGGDDYLPIGTKEDAAIRQGSEIDATTSATASATLKPLAPHARDAPVSYPIPVPPRFDMENANSETFNVVPDEADALYSAPEPVPISTIEDLPRKNPFLSSLHIRKPDNNWAERAETVVRGLGELIGISEAPSAVDPDQMGQMMISHLSHTHGRHNEPGWWSAHEGEEENANADREKGEDGWTWEAVGVHRDPFFASRWDMAAYHHVLYGDLGL